MEGFYVLCANDYDDCVRLLHTDQPGLDVSLDRLIEQGSTRFFDMHIS